jgi:hypothetical protein
MSLLGRQLIPLHGAHHGQPCFAALKHTLMHINLYNFYIIFTAGIRGDADIGHAGVSAGGLGAPAGGR